MKDEEKGKPILQQDSIEDPVSTSDHLSMSIPDIWLQGFAHSAMDMCKISPKMVKEADPEFGESLIEVALKARRYCSLLLDAAIKRLGNAAVKGKPPFYDVYGRTEGGVGTDLEDENNIPSMMRVKGPANYYGGIWVKTENGKYFWAIEDHSGFGWVEMPEKLYRAILEYHDDPTWEIGLT